MRISYDLASLDCLSSLARRVQRADGWIRHLHLVQTTRLPKYHRSGLAQCCPAWNAGERSSNAPERCHVYSVPRRVAQLTARTMNTLQTLLLRRPRKTYPTGKKVAEREKSFAAGHQSSAKDPKVFHLNLTLI